MYSLTVIRHDFVRLVLISVLLPALLFGPALYFNTYLSDAMSGRMMQHYATRLAASQSTLIADSDDCRADQTSCQSSYMVSAWSGAHSDPHRHMAVLDNRDE
jgi:hypothetical protein